MTGSRPLARLEPDLGRLAQQPRPWPLPPALDAERHLLALGGPALALYLSPLAAAAGNAPFSGPVHTAGSAAATAPTGAPRSGAHKAGAATPLLLVHSVHAAASAAELRPAFERLATAARPVVALELPGFGSSTRDKLHYTPRMMTQAILRAVRHLRERGLRQPVDVLGVQLSCEFVVRAALAQPQWFRSVALVNPTGLEADRIEAFENGRSAERVLLHRLLEMGPWSQPLYRLLTSRPVLRHQLRRLWGSKQVDDALLRYSALTVAVPGARHAPYADLSGALRTLGMAELYASVVHPVWVAHGASGGFADARPDHGALRRIGPPSHWTVDVFDSSAVPCCDASDAFAQRYEAFLASRRVTTGRLPRAAAHHDSLAA